mgnify:CR=1 FL=1
MNVNVSSDTSTYTITGLTPGMVYDILCFVSNDSVPSLQNISLSAYTSKYTLFKSAHTTELYTGFEVFFWWNKLFNWFVYMSYESATDI